MVTETSRVTDTECTRLDSLVHSKGRLCLQRTGQYILTRLLVMYHTTIIFWCILLLSFLYVILNAKVNVVQEFCLVLKHLRRWKTSFLHWRFCIYKYWIYWYCFGLISQNSYFSSYFYLAQDLLKTFLFVHIKHFGVIILLFICFFVTLRSKYVVWKSTVFWLHWNFLCV